tara:strand:- start:139 stop:1854 length:1716 start_codon:yes stop_codon:yes gene_type:complete
MEFKAQDKLIKDVLFSGTNKFRIPRYQRPYSWGIDQINEFWNDLDNEKESYFLGGFIFNYESEKDGYIDVIDGQQRILTITIFIAVLRDICKNINRDLSRIIQTSGIAFVDPYTMDQTYKVEVGDSTREYFEKYIQSGENHIYGNKGITKEEKSIYNAYDFFHKKVTKSVEGKQDKASKVDWINDIRKRLDSLNVIKIEIQSEEDAYEIFETTNARGVDLSVSDLLKNVILKHISKEKKEIAKDTWERITKNIENSNTELKKFIRYYWLSKYSFVTDKKLFKAIKNEIVNHKAWGNLLIELEKDSINWFKIAEGNESEFSDNNYESKIFPSVEGLRIMKVEQCNVFLLSILRNIDKIKTSPIDVIKFIENFTFQYSAINKLPGNKVEKLYSKYAVKVDKIVTDDLPKHIPGRIQQCFHSIIEELKELLEKEQYFLDNFNKVTYKKKSLSQYILARINNHMELTNEKNINFNNVNIEHILPQKPEKWALSQSEVSSYVHLLGNLTLLHDGLNRTVGNDTLSKKLIHLKKSQLEITKDFIKNINDENTWGEEEIKERQTRFGKLAYNEIWKIK